MTVAATSAGARLRRWRGPPLAFQILGLLIGGLVVAQFVTLFLTMVLPPAPPSLYGLDDIAAVLRGDEAAGERRDELERTVQTGPPDLSGPGWLVSERSRRELSALLGVGDRDVSLSFYTPLPFAGSAQPPPREPMADAMADDGLMPALSGAAFRSRAVTARLILAQVPAAPPPGPPPGPTPPPGALPSPGRLPPIDGGGIRPFGDRPPPLVRGGFARDGMPPRGLPTPARPSLPAGALPRGAGTLYAVDPTPLTGPYIPGDGGVAVPPLLQAPAAPPTVTGPPSGAQSGALLPADAIPGRGAGGFAPDAPPQAASPFGGPGFGLPGRRGDPLGGLADQPAFRRVMPAAALPPAPLRPVAPLRQTPPPAPPSAPAAPPAAVERVVPAGEPPAPPVPSAPLIPADRPDIASPAPADPLGPAIAVTPPARGLFGLAAAPFVEGDFVAALRLADGRWAVVQPADQSFPNAWQRRLLLWFAVAFAIVAPLGWLFARRLVKPLAGFAAAAERLGRDPAGAVIALDGPAEMGRAARAFNLMQNRLRSFVDDRTAMVGAISHDLRTPLTRLRFRIEDVPDDQREGMLAEVAEMEAMITSVLDFIRDASTPNARERLDLRTLIDDVVEDAQLIGADVTVERGASATVEVDVLGMRRVLDNLLENAVKYGARARVRLRTEPDAAVTEIYDDGPGLPDDELERVFEPFYRTEAALSSGAKGTGLGLAVCRSITRAHGGDVRLLRSAEGFLAQLRVPLAA